MKYFEVKLTGQNQIELDTELRFILAGARVDGVDLLRIDFDENAEDILRIVGCAVKVLRSIRKERIIQFFLDNKLLDKKSTEAEFIINKYADFVLNNNTPEHSFYIKI
jgi:hypothetical protein